MELIGKETREWAEERWRELLAKIPDLRQLTSVDVRTAVTSMRKMGELAGLLAEFLRQRVILEDACRRIGCPPSGLCNEIERLLEGYGGGDEASAGQIKRSDAAIRLNDHLRTRPLAFSPGELNGFSPGLREQLLKLESVTRTFSEYISSSNDVPEASPVCVKCNGPVSPNPQDGLCEECLLARMKGTKPR